MSRIDETNKQMEAFIQTIKAEALKHSVLLEEDGKNQVNEIANKTIDTINNSISKLVSMKESVSDDNQLEDFLNRLENKCKDVTDFTITKINEIKPIKRVNLADLQNDLEKNFDDFKKDLEDDSKEASTIKIEDSNNDSYFDKFLENENVQSAIKLVNAAKEKAIEFYNDPKTQKAINEAKLKTIEIAEKGLDSLKTLLEKNDVK